MSIHDSNFAFVKGKLEYVSPHEGLFQVGSPFMNTIVIILTVPSITVLSMTLSEE
jgi:hypothetical protein